MVKELAARGFKVASITDHGNVSGFSEHEKACKEFGIKPIYGCEFYFSDEEKSKKRYHLTVLAKNLNGYVSLLRAVSCAWKNFYYFPILKSEHLKECCGDWIVLSGCLDGRISQYILENEYDNAKKLALDYKQMLGNRFYLEIQPFTLEEVVKVGKGLIQLHKETGIPMVATNDVHYPCREYRNARRILRAIRFRKKIEEVEPDTQDMSILDYDTCKERLVDIYGSDWDIDEALKNAVRIANDVEEYSLPKAEAFAFDAENKVEMLRKLCWDGMAAKGFVDNKIYIDRMNCELGLVEKKGFVDYFLTIWDIVRFAKNNGVFVGPGRGSSGGSLVCFLLGITEVDPIHYGLLFERFIDVTRTDLPDIDIDFDDEHRGMVFDYITQKYGSENVAHLATFAFFKGRNSIDEIQKVFGLPEADAIIFKSHLIERASADSRASFSILDTIQKFPKVRKIVEANPKFKLSAALEGQIRHLSTHAAGVVVSTKPLYNYAAMYKVRDRTVVSISGEDAAYLNFLKIDILGLKALSILRRICEMIGWIYDDLLKISMDDKKTLEGFKKTDVKGIFQYDGRTSWSILKNIEADTFDLIRDVNALSRPGPLYSRDTSNYISIRHGKEIPDKICCALLDEITKDTYKQILYQEQVMRIVKEIGNFSWADTAKIRKAMSKSMGEEYMKGFKEKFAEGAVQNGYTFSQGKEIWDRVNSHGSWSFNKSHSVAYTILAFWMMYMKQHYSLQFFAASLQLEDDEDNANSILLDYLLKGGKLLSPRINYSSANYKVDGDALRSGLCEIKGIGLKTAQAIVSGYPYKDLEDMKSKLPKRSFNSRVERLVVENNLFDEVPPDKIFSVINRWNKISAAEGVTKILDINYFVLEKSLKNVKIVGFIIDQMLYNIFEEDRIQNRERKYADSELQDYMVITISDLTGSIKGRISRYLLPQYNEMLKRIDNTIPIEFTCEVRRNSRVVDIGKMEEVK